MEKGFESWFRDRQIGWQSTNPNSTGAPFGLRHRLNVPPFWSLPVLPFPTSVPEEPFGQFHGFTLKEPLPVARPAHEVQKKFLVFDQSNDGTTLIYGSTPAQYHLPRPPPEVDPKEENSAIEKHEDIHCDEMREDTEELNALLYSDDDDDETGGPEDEEERSTGHSPSMMPGFAGNEWRAAAAEEVASSTGPRKRHKLDHGGYDVVSLEDTASSGKSGVNCSGEAELSSCGDNGGAGNRAPEVESGTLLFSGKRSRKEKVRETINVLRNLIPGGKNVKDSMMILDEAIDYLRVLKANAKALGLDSP